MPYHVVWGEGVSICFLDTRIFIILRNKDEWPSAGDWTLIQQSRTPAIRQKKHSIGRVCLEFSSIMTEAHVFIFPDIPLSSHFHSLAHFYAKLVISQITTIVRGEYDSLLTCTILILDLWLRSITHPSCITYCFHSYYSQSFIFTFPWTEKQSVDKLLSHSHKSLWHVMTPHEKLRRKTLPHLTTPKCSWGNVWE